MALTNLQLQARIEAIETMLNTIQLALNNLVSRTEMKALQNIRQNEIATLQTEMDTAQSEIEVLQEEFIAGIPIVLTSSQIDAIEEQLDHGSILGLFDNDHTQYYNSVTTPIVASGQQLTLNVNTSDFSIEDGKLTFAGEAGITDHGVLTGLTDDDHTGYLTEGRAETWLTNRANAIVLTENSPGSGVADPRQLSNSESGKICLTDDLVGTPPIFLLPDNSPIGTTFSFCGWWAAGVEIRTPAHGINSYEIYTGNFVFTSSVGEYLKINYADIFTITLVQVGSVSSNIQSWVALSSSDSLVNWVASKVTP